MPAWLPRGDSGTAYTLLTWFILFHGHMCYLLADRGVGRGVGPSRAGAAGELLARSLL